MYIAGRARKKDCDTIVQWASESSFFIFHFSFFSFFPLLTLLVLWASWKELKEQACYIACPEKCAEEVYK